MSLQFRLTLVYTLALAVVLLGIGVTLYLYLARDLREDFEEDLARLAAAYAQLAIGPEGVALRALPPAPIREEIEDPEVFLLNTRGEVLQAISSIEELPQIPSGALEQALAGRTASYAVPSPTTRPLWWVALSPLAVAHEKRAVLYPIVTAETAFRTAYIVMIQATDLGTIRVLNRLRDSLLIWLGLGNLLAVGVGYVLARYVTRPLREIAHTASLVGSGELNQRIPRAGSKDEIGQLKERLNAMLERLENLVDAQRRFTADAAHDLRTPLTVIRSDIEITLRRERSAAEYRQTLERLRDEVIRLTRLAEDLLTLSRLEAGLSNPFETFVLAEALEAIIPTHAQAAAQKGLDFYSEIPANLLVHGDAGLITRAISNLLSNAITYTEHGKTGIKATSGNGKVRIEVWDTGPGIPTEQQAFIFERFRKGERSKGAGLGLSIAMQVALLHQGRIRVLNRSGGGAVFVLEVPEGSDV